MEPAKQAAGSIGLLGEARAIGSFFLLGPDLPGRIERSLVDLLARRLPHGAAVSRLPSNAGLYVRVLAPHSGSLRQLQGDVLSLARHLLFSRTVGPTYKP